MRNCASRQRTRRRNSRVRFQLDGEEKRPRLDSCFENTSAGSARAQVAYTHVSPMKLLATAKLVFQMQFVSASSLFDSEEKEREFQENVRNLKEWELRSGMTVVPRLDLTQMITTQERAELVSVLAWMLDGLLGEIAARG